MQFSIKQYGSTPAGEERGAYRENILKEAGGSMMKFETRAKKVFRHGPTATMVRQLLFYEGKGYDPEGYVYITYPQWWDEEGLTRTEIDTARHKLGAQGAGVLEEVRKGVFNRLHYRLNLERLGGVMFPELDSPTAEDPVPEDQALNHDFTVQGSSSSVCRVPAVQCAGMGPSHYREYSESTSENFPPIVPPKGDEVDKKPEGPEDQEINLEGLDKVIADYEERVTKDKKTLEEILTTLDEVYGNDEDTTTATEMDSAGLEDHPEGSITSENVDAWNGALDEAVGKLIASPHDSTVGRLALAVVKGKRSGEGPITREHVAQALRDELNLGKAAALAAADQVIEAVRT